LLGHSSFFSCEIATRMATSSIRHSINEHLMKQVNDSYKECIVGIEKYTTVGGLWGSKVLKKIRKSC
jgi:hypothetical protein